MFIIQYITYKASHSEMDTMRNFKLKNAKQYPWLLSVEAEKETGAFPVKTTIFKKSSRVHIYFREREIYIQIYIHNIPMKTIHPINY